MKQYLSKMKIIGSILALGLVVVLLSQTTLADRIYFPFGFINKLFNFQSQNQLTIGPYKDGTIVLVKPVATGVGSSRAEAGDVVEIRDGQELYQRFGDDKPFLGARERTKLLVFYYDGKLTQEQKEQLISPVYETQEGAYITQKDLEQMERNQIEDNPETDTNPDPEPQVVKNRAYGIDYTQLLSDKDILIARDPDKGFDKLPELDLTYLIKKQTDQFSVIEMTDKLVRYESITQKIENTLDKLIPSANAQTACVSIVDPDNGDGTDYLSLNTWESTEERDLVTANETETATCRSTSGTADTTAVTIDNWTTDATRYIKVWTDPDEGYRHNGKWDETAYRLDIGTGNYNFIMTVKEGYTKIIGIQFCRDSRDDTSGTLFGVHFDGSDYSTFSHNILKSDTEGGSTALLSYDKLYVYNNIIYNNWSYGISSSAYGTDDSVYYNNTIYNCNRGLYINIRTSYVKNCICYNNSTYDFYSENSYKEGSGYNISSDGTAPGSNSRANATISFVDEANDDYHLASTDTEARNNGADLSADENLAFTDDIDGDTRAAGTDWDIGADERTSTKIITDPTGYRYISDPSGSNPTPFISTIMESGGDYSSLFDWEDAVECNLAAETTRVYSGSLTGSLSENTSVTLADSGGTPYAPAITGTVVAHTANGQILIDNINGSDTLQVSNNDRWEADDSNYWTVSGSDNQLGDTAYAVAKIDGAWDEADTKIVRIEDWATDADHYIKIYTTDTARHDGKWDEGKYRMQYTKWNTIIYIKENYVHVDGLQFNCAGEHTGAIGYVLTDENDTDQSLIQISNNILKQSYGNNDLTGLSFGMYCTSYIWNNIIYDFNNGIKTSTWNNYVKSYVFNNTIYNCSFSGIRNGGANAANTQIYLKNNLVQNCGIDYAGLNVNLVPVSINNLSSDDTADDVCTEGCVVNADVAFLSEANNDFHLAGSDTDARDAGSDLSNDANLAFSDDIDGETRSGAWDIGADERKRSMVINAPLTNTLTDGLVGHWTFDGPDMDWSASSAEAIDQSGQGNDGDVTNMSQSSVRSGISGQALEFDGDDDYVEKDTAIISDYPFTLSAWVKPDSTESRMAVFVGDKDDEDKMAVIGIISGHFTASQRYDGDWTYNGSVVPNGEWQHIVGVFNNATDRKNYVNGVLDDTDTLSRNFPDVDRFSIGRCGDSTPDTNWDGLIDEVRIYNRALSADEIGELYQAGTRRATIRE